MIRKIKGGDSETKESKIISTQDIVLGTDIDTSDLTLDEYTLDEYLNEQSKDIQNLKKWTKWAIKYGGMGTGSGGGGGSSSMFGYSLYIRDEANTKIEEVKATTHLFGKGKYVLAVNLTKTQGHSFQVSYWIGTSPTGKPTGTAFIPEGRSGTEINLGNLSEKFILSCQIKDNSTDDGTRVLSFTIIPESYSVTKTLRRLYDGTSINRKTSGGTGSGETTFTALKSGLLATIGYTIYENITLYFKIRYKFELESESEWKYVELDNSEKSISGSISEVITGELSKKIEFDNINQDEIIGQKLQVELICNTNPDSLIAENGVFETTIIPQGYYISLTDGGTGALYLSMESMGSVEEDDVVKTKKGPLPFYINLKYGSKDTIEVGVEIQKYNENNNSWVTDVSRTTSQLDTNIQYPISKRYEVSISDSGKFRIIATASIDGNTISTTKYFWVDELSVLWSFDSFIELSQSDIVNAKYVNYGDTEEKVGRQNTNPILKTPLSLYTNSYETANLINDDEGGSESFNESIVVGIQYDSSNNDSIPFLELINTNSSENNIKVYQNKIVQGENFSLINNYYFPKTDNSDSSVSSKWHLLHININYIKTINSRVYYEFCVYIDGQLEGIATSSDDSGSGGYTTAINNNLKINKLLINPRKSQIIKVNLIDLSRITHERAFYTTLQDSQKIGNYSFSYDAFAVSYYNKYRTSIGLESDDRIQDFSSILNFKFDELSLPFLEDGGMKSLLNNGVGVPTVILCPRTFSGANSDLIKNWFYPIWDESVPEEQEALLKASGPLIYIPENTSIQTGWDSTYEVKRSSEQGGESYSFTFEIQGTSTKANGIKNIELYIGSSDGKTMVFTPKFDREDPKGSFLPEVSFTLKADMVDSSLCNNNSIGDFINNNTKSLDETNKRKVVGDFEDYIKNCLIGFPILLFLCDKSNEISTGESYRYYFVGIYNFNLGRQSYFNLGYYDRESYEGLSELLSEPSTPGLKVFELSSQPQENKNLCVVEVSKNSEYWDFSQFDSSVLFKVPENAYDINMSMFSDSSGKKIGEDTKIRSRIGDAIKSISRGGGYIFENLRKTFIDIDTAHQNYEADSPYRVKINGKGINAVANYRTQYTRNLSTYIKKAEKEDPATLDDLISCIGVYKPDEEDVAPNTPWIDLRSLVEYYVICQCFGMVDSVLKNLQLKSWGDNIVGPNTVFPAFYDMDTSLGVNNDGDDIDYFAFSDFWEVDNSTTDISGEENVYIAGEAIIYPDFWDSNFGSGFDYPSHYLFALAKYATMSIMGSGRYLPTMTDSIGNPRDLSPVNLYSYYRSIGNDLETADKFINERFVGRLSGIPTTLKNLNVRAKYAKVAYWLISDGNNYLFNPEIKDNINDKMINLSNVKDLEKFKGSGKFKKRDWLNSRLHLLDAYFNLSSNVMYKVKYSTLNGNEVTWSELKNGNLNVYYPIRTSVSDSYSDVPILNQIFPTTHRNAINSRNILVKSHKLTPIIYWTENAGTRTYLVGDDTQENQYKINISNGGSTGSWSLYGSRELNYINDLGEFSITSDQTVISEKLKEVIYLATNQVNVTGDISVQTPNVERVVVNGVNQKTKYTGNLLLNENYSYNRLNEIDLSKSGINLSNSGFKGILSKLNLENCVPTNGVFALPNASFSNDCEVRLNGSKFERLSIPEWKENIVITSDSSISGYGSDYYRDVKKLGELILTSNNNFSEGSVSLTLVNIETLTKVTIGKNIKSLKIVNCKRLRTVTIQGGVGGEIYLENLTITNCSSSAEDFTIGQTTNTIDFSNAILVNPNFTLNMKGTRKFNKVSIGSNTVFLSAGAFDGCTELTYLDNDTTGCYYLNGNSTFNACRNFTLTQSNYSEVNKNYPNILTKPGVTNLSNTFRLSSSTENNSIKLNAANNFLENNKGRGITNINYMFFHQTGIGEDWTWSSRLSLSGNGGYSDITSCEHSFDSCKIKYWSKELFDFGSSSGVGIVGTFFYRGDNNTVVYVKQDFLNNMKTKLTSYIDSASDNANIQYYIVCDSSGNKLNTPVALSNILGGLTKCTSLTGLCFRPDDGQIINLRGCFRDSNKIESISRFLYSGIWEDLTWEEDGLIYSCFSELTRLNNFDRCFGTVDSRQTTEIDLYYLFDQLVWKKIKINVSDNDTLYISFGNTFSAKKKITKANYTNLCRLLDANTSLTQLNSLFKNCRITNCGGSEYFSITKFNRTGSNGDTRIVSLRELFKNMTAWNDSDVEIPIKIEENFFDNLKGVKRCLGTFSGLWLLDPPFFNFFRKRTEILKTSDAYFPKKTENPELIRETAGKIYVYTVTEGNNTPSEQSTITDEILEVEDLIDNNIWSKQRPIIEKAGSPLPYNYWRAELSSGEIDENTIIKEFEILSVEVEVKYRTYSSDISIISNIFENSTFKNPFFTLENKNNFRSYIKPKDESINIGEANKYYTDIKCTELGAYEPSIEIDDLDNIEVDGATSKVTINGRDIENLKIDTSKSLNTPLISPDFFYGVSSNCDAKSAFLNTTSNSNNQSGDKYVLQGYLPKNLLNKHFGMELENFIGNLNVLPIKDDEDLNTFVFVPKGFVDNRTNFDNLLNFNIRVPIGNNITYYVLYSNSITNENRRISGNFNKCLPAYAKTANDTNNRSAIVYLGNNESVRALNVVTTNFNFRYKLIKGGYFNEIFPNSNYSNFFSAHLIHVLSDNEIWSTGISLSQINDNIDDEATFIWGTLPQYGSGVNSQRGVNKNFKFPKTTENVNNYKLHDSSDDEGHLRINISSIGSNEGDFWRNGGHVVES